MRFVHVKVEYGNYEDRRTAHKYHGCLAQLQSEMSEWSLKSHEGSRVVCGGNGAIFLRYFLGQMEKLAEIRFFLFLATAEILRNFKQLRIIGLNHAMYSLH